jgi:hypothetical protein
MSNPLRTPAKKIRALLVALPLVMAAALIAIPIPTVQAVTKGDVDSIDGHTPFFDPHSCGYKSGDLSGCISSGSCQVGGETSSLVGKYNKPKIWNYFTSNRGLSGAAAAGIMGNMKAESKFDPSAHQTKDAWHDLSNARYKGVGLVQWDGGRRPKVIKYLKSRGVTNFTKPSDKMLAGELDYIWKEATGSYKSTLKQLKSVSNTTGGAGQAAFIWHKGYERSRDSKSQIQKGRVDPAKSIFREFNGSSATGSAAPTAGGTSGCAGGGSALSPDCKSAKGLAQLVCDAKRYDNASYSESAKGNHMSGGTPEWIKKVCPAAGQPGKKIPTSCYLDCSGLVNLVVYQVFHVNIKENTGGERADIGKYWKKIRFSQLQPGDLVQPSSGHVELIDHVQGHELYTFAAHTSGVPQPKQVGPDHYPAGSGFLYLRYIGPGSPAK